MYSRISAAGAISSLLLGLTWPASATSQAIERLPPVLEEAAFDAERNAYFWLRHWEGRQPGDTRPFTSAGGIYYLAVDEGVLLLELQGLSTNQGRLGATVGLAYRREVLDQFTGGLHLGFDVNQSPFGHTFQQAALGLELSGPVWRLRGNAYFPLGDTTQTILSDASTEVYFQDQFLVYENHLSQLDEVALAGVDLELGHQFQRWRGEWFVGGYLRDGLLGGATQGATSGLRGALTDALDVQVATSYDPFFGWNAYGGITWFVGRSAVHSWDNRQLALRAPPERNRQVAVREVPRVITQTGVFTSDDVPLTFAHVASSVGPPSTSAATGTLLQPYTSLAQASASDSDVIYIHAGSVFTGESLTLDPRQLVLGDGAGVVHFIITDQLGATPLPAPGMGLARPRIVDAPGSAIELASGSMVRNLAIESPAGAGVFADAGVDGLVALAHLTIEGGTHGFQATGSPATFVFEDVQLHDATVANLELVGGAADLYFDGQLEQSTSGHLFAVSGGHTGNVQFAATSSIQGTSGQGIHLDQAQGNYEFLGQTTITGGTSGISIVDSGGLMHWGAETTLQNISGPAFVVHGGAPTVQYQGDLAGTAGATWIEIADTVGGEVVFEGGSLTHVAGNGILLDGVHGDVTIRQDLLLANSGGQGLALTGGGTGRYTFADVTIIGAALRGLDLSGSAATIQIDSLLIEGTGSEGLFADNTTTAQLLVGQDSTDVFQVGNTGATAVYFHGSAMQVVVAASGNISGEGVDALIFDDNATGDYLLPHVSVGVTQATDTAFSDAAAVSKLNGTSPQRIELNYVPPTGLSLYFAPLVPGPAASMLLVAPGTSFSLGSYVAALPSESYALQGFQLNFELSQVSAGELVLSNWTTDAAWPLTLGQLDSTSGQTLVAGATLGSDVLVGTVLLGTFDVLAPLAPGDYLLSLQSNNGAFETAFMQSDAAAAPILDYGDLLIRVEAP